MQILVLEQSPLMRRIIKEELSWGNYTVFEAETPDQARHILLSEPSISLMTLGTALEGSDGFDFLEEVNSLEFQQSLAPLNNDGLSTVFVTSNDNDADRLRGYHIGAADFIQKPWAKGELLSHVNNVLGCGAEMQGLSVLMVDDSPPARRFVHSCLSRLGVHVHEADDGDTALEFLRENKVDLVLTDLNMVRMNGDALCLKIRNELGLINLPVIFLSANEDKSTILALFKIGATDYLAKPFIQEELMARLKVHLEREMLSRTLREVAEIQTDDAITNMVAEQDMRGHGTKPSDVVPHWRILLVDDSPVNLAVGSKLLKKMGCDVDAASSGQQALSLFQDGKGNRFDMVLMDLMMPGMSGLEATKQIRKWETALAENNPEYGAPVPIVALTATNQDNQLAACLEAGMNDFLSKPFRLDMVRASLQRWAKEPVEA